MAAQAAEVDPFLATVLSTHFEMSSGASHYAPYIRSLPTEVRVPMVGTTSDEELRAIADLAVGSVVCAGKEVSLLESTAFPLLKTMARSAKSRGFIQVSGCFLHSFITSVISFTEKIKVSGDWARGSLLEASLAMW